MRMTMVVIMAAKKTKPPNTPNAIMPPEKFIYKIKMRLVLFYTPVRSIPNTNNNKNDIDDINLNEIYSNYPD